MSESTPRLGLPYPSLDDDPWFDTFESFALALDASIYAAREDRHFTVVSSATFTFTASPSGTLSWNSSIEFINAITGYTITVPSGSIALADGEFAYFNLTRYLQSNQNTNFTAASTVPNTDSAMLFCVRKGNSVYFVRGARVDDGIPDTPLDQISLSASPYYGFSADALDPAPSGVNNYLWMNSSNQLEIHANGANTTIPSYTGTAANGEFLQYQGDEWVLVNPSLGTTNGLLGAYQNASSAAQNIIGLTTALGALIVRDNASPLGTTLFGVQDSAGTTKYVDVQADALFVAIPVAAANGAVSTPSYSFTNASGAGMYYDGAGAVHITADGATSIAISGGATNASLVCGNVVSKVTAGSAASIAVYGGNGNQDLIFTSSTAGGAGAVQFAASTGTVDAQITRTAAGVLRYVSDDTTSGKGIEFAGSTQLFFQAKQYNSGGGAANSAYVNVGATFAKAVGIVAGSASSGIEFDSASSRFTIKQVANASVGLGTSGTAILSLLTDDSVIIGDVSSNQGGQLSVLCTASQSSGGYAGIKTVSTFDPGSGTGSYADLHLNPTINGTSSGKATALAIASKTNTLTGSSGINLIDAGTTTTDYFTGYTSLFAVDTAGKMSAVGGASIGASSGASFSSVGALTLASSSGSSTTVTVSINGPLDYYPLQMNSSGVGAIFYRENSGGMDAYLYNLGKDHTVTLHGTTQAFVITGDSGTVDHSKLKVVAPASQNAPVTIVQGGATPTSLADLQQWQNSSSGILAKIDNAGNFTALSATIGATAALPTASSSNRGMLYTVQGASSVADVTYQCQKNTSDAYVWEPVSTGSFYYDWENVPSTTYTQSSSGVSNFGTFTFTPTVTKTYIFHVQCAVSVTVADSVVEAALSVNGSPVGVATVYEFTTANQYRWISFTKSSALTAGTAYTIGIYFESVSGYSITMNTSACARIVVTG